MPTAQEKAEAKLAKLQATATELGVEFTSETTVEELSAKVQEVKAAAKAEEKAKARVDEEVIEARNGFSFVRVGEEYSVKNSSGQLIAPLGDRAVAEQLFRNTSRKF